MNVRIDKLVHVNLSPLLIYASNVVSKTLSSYPHIYLDNYDLYVKYSDFDKKIILMIDEKIRQCDLYVMRRDRSPILMIFHVGNNEDMYLLSMEFLKMFEIDYKYLEEKCVKNLYFYVTKDSNGKLIVDNVESMRDRTLIIHLFSIMHPYSNVKVIDLLTYRLGSYYKELYILPQVYVPSLNKHDIVIIREKASDSENKWIYNVYYI